MKKIAFFDLDGTVTKKDTFIEYVKFSKGYLVLFWAGIINSLWLVGYKLKIVSNKIVKERMLRFFFGGTLFSVFQKSCDSFSRQILPSLIRPSAFDEIKRLQKEGFNIVIVSASPENWIAKWAIDNNLELIATQLEVKDTKITGKIIGSNCYGKEKVKRIRQRFDLTDYDKIYAYGDTYSDRYMLQLAQSQHFKPFK